MDPARGRRWVRARGLPARRVRRTALAVPADALRRVGAAATASPAPLHRAHAALGIDGRRGAGRARARRSRLAAIGGARRRRAHRRARLATAGAVARGARRGRLVDAARRCRPRRAPTASGAPAVHADGHAPRAAADDGSEQVTVRGAVLVRVAGARPLGRGGARRAAARAARRRRRAARARGRGAGRAAAPRRSPALGARSPAGSRWRRSAPSSRRCCFAGSSTPPALGCCSASSCRCWSGSPALELPLAVGLRGAGRGSRSGFGVVPAQDPAARRSLLSEPARLRHGRARAPAAPAARAADAGRRTSRTAVSRSSSSRPRSPGSIPRGAALALALAARDAADPASSPSPSSPSATCACATTRARSGASTSTRCSVWSRSGRTAPSRRSRASTAIASPSGCARRARRCAPRWRRRRVQALVGFGLGAWLLVDFFARAPRRARRPIRAPRCSSSTGRCRCRRSGTSSRCFVQQLPGAAQPDACASSSRSARPRSERTPRTPSPASAAWPRRAGARGGAAGVASSCATSSWWPAGHKILGVDALAIAPGRARRDRRRVGRGQVEPASGLLLGWHRPAAGTVDGRRARRSTPPRSRRCAADRVGRSRRVSVEPLARRQPRLRAGVGARRRSRRRSRDADLEEVAARLPRGAETPLGEAGGLLSGGEGQRVRFGARRAAPARRALVLLDEPFRGLDRAISGARCWRARARRWPGATLLCVTHDIGETEAFRARARHRRRQDRRGRRARRAARATPARATRAARGRAARARRRLVGARPGGGSALEPAAASPRSGA